MKVKKGTVKQAVIIFLITVAVMVVVAFVVSYFGSR